MFSKKAVPLPKIYKTDRFKVVMFNERIKQLRGDRQSPQRKLAAAMDIDTASYCKIEKTGLARRYVHITNQEILHDMDYIETKKNHNIKYNDNV
jgi:DNA-binding XRE family transcriptional regulator